MARTLGVLIGATVGLVLILPTELFAQQQCGDPPQPSRHYAHAVRAGDLLFLSGVVSRDPDPLTQFRETFQLICGVLEDAGSSMERVVEINTYHVDLHEHIDEFIEAKDEYLPKKPAWTAVGVTELYAPEAYIEVRLIATVAGDTDSD